MGSDLPCWAAREFCFAAFACDRAGLACLRLRCHSDSDHVLAHRLPNSGLPNCAMRPSLLHHPVLSAARRCALRGGHVDLREPRADSVSDPMPLNTVGRAAIFPTSIRAGWARGNCCCTAAILTVRRSRARFRGAFTVVRSIRLGPEVRNYQQGFDYPVYVVFASRPRSDLPFEIVRKGFFWVLLGLTVRDHSAVAAGGALACAAVGAGEHGHLDRRQPTRRCRD